MSTTVESPRVVVCSNCGAKDRLPAASSGVPRCGNCHSPLPWVDASDADFVAVVEEASIPVLVDVWAPCCGPCRMVSPVLEQLAGEMAGQLKLVQVNADESPQVSSRFEVQAISTLILLDQGEMVDKQVVAAPAPALRSWLTDKLGEQEP